MGALCLFLASGALAAIIPADTITLAWTHSVEQTEWQERYVVRGGRLEIAQAAVRGSGAGMEPPEGAVLSGGWWRYTPVLPALDELRLARSDFTSDYRVCWGGRCQPLADLVPLGDQPTATIVRPCRGKGTEK